jgi:hypothetical protein
MQKLLIYQSLWAMERRRPDALEWSLDEKLQMIATEDSTVPALDSPTDLCRHRHPFPPVLRPHLAGTVLSEKRG